MSIDPQQPDRYAGEDLSRRIQETADALGESSSPPVRPSAETLASQPACPPKKIGQFHVKSVVASGGMGTVYEAVQDHPRRTVAVKVLKRGIASPSAMRRFEYESQTLARLRHPGIAQVYEAGTYDDGAGVVPYFAMEYIPHALPITTYAKEKSLSSRQKLELFAHVCDAVHHGHQKGIIHRDLKPGNILVDSHGDVKVIDFGVARGTDSDMAVTTLQTDIGQLIGTLQYMSPEQCVADPHDIDTRSDVYALGVVLYELLSGKPPYDVSKKPVLESTRVIREEQPTRLSTVDATLRGDTETIVFKALEKDRERRYQSAIELAQDIRRHLAGEAIVARPPSIVYQLRVFARRNKAFFTAVAAAFVVLIAGVIVSTSLYVQAERQRERAVIAEQDQSRERQRSDIARKEAEEARSAEAEQRRLAEVDRDRAIEAEELALTERREARRQAYLANISAARVAWTMNEVSTARKRLEAVPREFRNWEWSYLYAESDNSLAVLRGHQEAVYQVAFSPDGRWLASASRDKTVRVWNPSTGEQRSILTGHSDEVNGLAFSPDGLRLASYSDDKTIRLWDTLTRAQLAVLDKHGDKVSRVAFSPDGTRLASASADKTVRLWDVSAGEQLAVLKGHEGVVYGVAFSPDGARLASCSGDKTIRLWNAYSGKEQAVLRGHDDRLLWVAFSPDGHCVAATGWGNNTVRVWDSYTGEQLAALRGHDSWVYSLAFSPDGTRLATGSGDKTVRLWSPLTGEQVAVLRGHDEEVGRVAFSPDGTRLASADGKTVRLWNPFTGEQLAVLKGHEDHVFSLAFSPDGTRLASASFDNTVRLWDPSADKRLSLLSGHQDMVTSVAFSPDGTRLASAGGWYKRLNRDDIDNTVRIWNTDTGEELAVLRGHEDWVESVASSPDGSRLASASDDKTIRIWDASTGEEMAVLRGHGDDVRLVTFSPDGMYLASASWDGTLRLWDSSSGKELRVLRGHEGHVWSVCFSPDGSEIASAGVDDKTIRLWETLSGTLLATLRGHDASVLGIAFGPDGTRLASASGDAIRLWDMASRKELAVLRGHQQGVMSVAFSPDGSRLASASWDSTVRIWDAVTGEELAILKGQDWGVNSVAFSPDGTRLASGAADRTVRIWDSVPYRFRCKERRAILSAQPDAERIVGGLWQQLTKARSIAERLRADASLTQPQRRAALNLLLSRSAQLQEHVNALYARLVFTDDIVAALEADDSLAPGLRYKAVAAARAKGDRPLRLNRDSWNLVRSPGGDPEAYKLGLRGAEAAVTAEPENVVFLSTLGVAQYRNGRYEDAYATLSRCDELRRQQGGKGVPRVVAFHAMALFKLDQVEEARAMLDRLETLMEGDDDKLWWYNEDASPWLEECKQLLEGSNAQPKPPKNPEEGEK